LRTRQKLLCGIIKTAEEEERVSPIAVGPTSPSEGAHE
jgi:hypothetical protein